VVCLKLCAEARRRASWLFGIATTTFLLTNGCLSLSKLAGERSNASLWVLTPLDTIRSGIPRNNFAISRFVSLGFVSAAYPTEIYNTVTNGKPRIAAFCFK
jgi:hypothetical protein